MADKLKCAVPGCISTHPINQGFMSHSLCRPHLEQWSNAAQYRRACAQFMDFLTEKEAELQNSRRKERG